MLQQTHQSFACVSLQFVSYHQKILKILFLFCALTPTEVFCALIILIQFTRKPGQRTSIFQSLITRAPPLQKKTPTNQPNKQTKPNNNKTHSKPPHTIRMRTFVISLSQTQNTSTKHINTIHITESWGTPSKTTHNSYRYTLIGQIFIFRLKTIHCQLLHYPSRLKISHPHHYPLSKGLQIPCQILQSCSSFDALRCQTWFSPKQADGSYRDSAVKCKRHPAY